MAAFMAAMQPSDVVCCFAQHPPPTIPHLLLLATCVPQYHKVLTYVEYRAVSGVFQNIDLPPSSPPSECVFPRTKGLAVRGVGRQYFGRRHP
jgi:hypothetical protein